MMKPGETGNGRKGRLEGQGEREGLVDNFYADPNMEKRLEMHCVV